MNFLKVLKAVVDRLEEASIDYALIGGFAMGLRGVQRATMDLDLILSMEDLEKTHDVLVGLGFQREFYSENVSHYVAGDAEWGRIDCLHAFRKPSLQLLKRAESLPVTSDLFIRVAQIEDLIGLKIQALTNDPTRTDWDWTDIRLLLQAAGAENRPLNWDLLEDYLSLFDLSAQLPKLHSWYGTHDSGRA